MFLLILFSQWVWVGSPIVSLDMPGAGDICVRNAILYYKITGSPQIEVRGVELMAWA